MKNTAHTAQRDAWEKEHAQPTALLQMDSNVASSGVQKFYKFLESKNLKNLQGVEMGCGKGRNVIWLAAQDRIKKIQGFDFSRNAIREAKSRAQKYTSVTKTNFTVADATNTLPFGDESFNFAIDCFASSDIESKEGREFAAREFIRVLKPGGYVLVYELSTDDEYHKMMLEKSPAAETGAFINPDGKFEKVFTKDELLFMYSGLTLVADERVEKVAEFYGKKYGCRHYWLVFQK